MNLLSRRHALQLTGAATLAAALPPQIFAAASERMKLSIAAYSFRKNFRYLKGKDQKPIEPAMDMRKFITFCKENGATGAELTSYFFPPDANAKYFRNIRKFAKQQGIAISGTAVGNNFSLEPGPERDKQMAYVKEWVDYAVVMGAPHIRIFAGKKKAGTTEERADHLVIEALQEACEYAGSKKIFLGLENHDSISTAGRLIRLLEAVDSKWLGINLDSGNFKTADPYWDFEECAPFAVNVQLKVNVRIGDEHQPADLERFMGILTKSGYAGWVALEYEAKEDPYETIPGVMKKLTALI